MLLDLIGGAEIAILVVLVIVIAAIVIVIRALFKSFSRKPLGKPNKPGTAKGKVRQYTISSESVNKGIGTNRTTKTVQVIRFMLECLDDKGKTKPYISIEMKGQVFSGIIGEGHLVEIYDKIIPGKLLLPKSIYNHTSQSMVRVEKQ